MPGLSRGCLNWEPGRLQRGRGGSVDRFAGVKAGRLPYLGEDAFGQCRILTDVDPVVEGVGGLGLHAVRQLEGLDAGIRLGGSGTSTAILEVPLGQVVDLGRSQDNVELHGIGPASSAGEPVS